MKTKPQFLKTLKELARAYQAFSILDSSLLRKVKLTSSQADVIFTLGNTEGLSYKEIGQLTLITKGTLTGVVERLQASGIVEKSSCPHDGRRMIVRLTQKGEEIFQSVFPSHLEAIGQRFSKLSESELETLEELLKRLSLSMNS